MVRAETPAAGGKAREVSLPRAAQERNSSLDDLRGFLRQDVVALEAECISLLAVWRINLRDPRLGRGRGWIKE